MLLRYRDPNFWKTFQARHWEPRVPTVLRQPFQEFPLSEEILCRALHSFVEGLEDGDSRKHCLVSVGGKETAPRRPLASLFQERSTSLTQLEQQCKRVFAQKPFGLMVTQMQAVDPGIWNAVTSFMQDGRREINLPAPRAFLDLFCGNYGSTFTGLHKDTQEIIAFVVRGPKRMLAWPFEYFLGRVKGLVPGDKYFNKRLSIDHSKFRKDAIVLDAQAGDVIYWPSDHWHVAEVQDGQFSAMLSLGLVRPEFVLPGSSDAKPFLSRDMTGIVPRVEAGTRLRWLTGYGFELGGPLAETAPEAVSVAKVPSSILLWTRTSSPRRLLVSANGQSITLPDSPKLVGLLERLAQGDSVPRAKMRRGRSTPSKVFETSWNKKTELKTRTRTSHGDDSAWLLDWLLRVHAVEASI